MFFVFAFCCFVLFWQKQQQNILCSKEQQNADNDKSLSLSVILMSLFVKSGKIPRIDIKNVNIKKKREISNSQSAGVCKDSLTAPQRIYAKELWYILGLFEADGSLSCYKEKNFLRLDLTIALEEKDAKLTHWIKKHMGHGQVKTVKYSYNKNRNLTRYIIRSKSQIINIWFKLFENYPLLTKNKRAYYNWIKASLEQKEILSKAKYFILCPKEPQYVNKQTISCNINENPYIKDWIIGFIEGDGSFYFTKINTGLRAEFNISQKNEYNLLKNIGEIIGLTGKNKISTKKNGQNILTAVSLQDIQAVVNFMCNKERVRLKGLKKIQFLLWLKELRVNPKYSGLKIPDIY